MEQFEVMITRSKQRTLRAALVLALLMALLAVGAQVASPAQAPAQPEQIGPATSGCPTCKNA